MSSHLKSFLCDPVPTSLLRKCIDYLAVPIFNLSLSCGVFPDEMKLALVTPFVKKPSLCPDDLNNYLFCFFSKFVERVVCKLLTTHLVLHNPYVLVQSAYQPNQTTPRKRHFLKLSMIFFWQQTTGMLRYWLFSIKVLLLTRLTIPSESTSLVQSLASPELFFRGSTLTYVVVGSLFELTAVPLLKSIFNSAFHGAPCQNLFYLHCTTAPLIQSQRGMTSLTDDYKKYVTFSLDLDHTDQLRASSCVSFLSSCVGETKSWMTENQK